MRASWMRTFESMPPLKMRLLSGEMATQTTLDLCLVFIWLTNVEIWVSSFGSLNDRYQSRTVLSALPDTMKDPSVENSIAAILLVCPMRSRHSKNRDCCWLAAKQFFLNDEMLRVKSLREAATSVESDVASVALVLVFADVLFFFDGTIATLKNSEQK